MDIKEQVYIKPSYDGCVGGHIVRVRKKLNMYRAEGWTIETMFNVWLREVKPKLACDFGYRATWQEAQKDLDEFAVSRWGEFEKLSKHEIQDDDLLHLPKKLFS